MAITDKIPGVTATWNPVTGCQKISPGCAHCFAEAMSIKQEKDFNLVTYHPERLKDPFTWRWQMVLAMTMSDFFLNPQITDQQRLEFLSVMAATGSNTYQIFTKRIDYAVEFFARYRDYEFHTSEDLFERQTLKWPLPNVWLIASCENQDAFDKRFESLDKINAVLKGVCCEPLLGPIKFGKRIEKLQYVIGGGETGDRARPMDMNWARSIRDECEAAGVPFLWRQNGEWAICTQDELGHIFLPDGRMTANQQNYRKHTFPDGKLAVLVGKYVTGRKIDGEIHDAIPNSKKGVSSNAENSKEIQSA